MDPLNNIIIVKDLFTNASTLLKDWNASLAKLNKLSDPIAASLQFHCSRIQSVLTEIQGSVVEPSSGTLRVQSDSALGGSLNRILNCCKTIVSKLNESLNDLDPLSNRCSDSEDWNESRRTTYLRSFEAQSATLQTLLSACTSDSTGEVAQILNSQQYSRTSQVVIDNANQLGHRKEHSRLRGGSLFESSRNRNFDDNENQLDISMSKNVHRRNSSQNSNGGPTSSESKAGLVTVMENDSSSTIDARVSFTTPFADDSYPAAFGTDFRQRLSLPATMSPPTYHPPSSPSYRSQARQSVDSTEQISELVVAENMPTTQPEVNPDGPAEEALLCRYILDKSQSAASLEEGQTAVSTETGSKVVVKRVSKLDAHKTACARREIAFLGVTTDVCIVPLVEWMEFDSSIWVVLGHRQEECLRRYVETRGSLSTDGIKSFVTQLFAGLAVIFMAGFSHLRLTNETMFLDDDFNLVIKDFQYAVEYGSEKVDIIYAPTEEKFGSDIYVAPEVFGARTYNARKAAVWSAGVCVYYAVTGQTARLSNLDHPSMEATEPSPVPKRRLSVASQSSLKVVTYPNSRLAVPNYVRDIISKMLVTNPAKRAELIEVATKVPKMSARKESRPLIELTWLDYKTHVGPLAGLNQEAELASSSSSIFSSASALSNPFSMLLGRRRSSVTRSQFA